MTIFTSDQPLRWGALDVPLLGLKHDWHRELLQVPAAFSLVMDGSRLWFIAHHGQAAALHPQSRPGKFLPELWKYDVAELFLADPVSGRYFEFNLAPNSAWWCCEFTAPRMRAEPCDIVMPDVSTFAELQPSGGWIAAMSLPLDLLCARLNFGHKTRANVTFVLDSPHHRYVTAQDLGTGEPDFHRPEHFSQVSFTPLPTNTHKI